MKKISILIIIIFTAFFITGCDKTIEKENGSTSVTNDIVKTGKMKHKHCTRGATADEEIEVSLNYDLYYTDDILNILKSEEKITSDDSSSLDEYEQAYNKIHSYYEGLQYYDNKVVRDSNSVTNKTTINYDRIDIKKLLEIEGEEDNIIENGKAKVDKWIELAKKFGTSCADVEE